jgi:hypothetical protein
LLDDELARAVRTESAEAVRYWWGVSEGVVHRWRKFLDVTRTNNPGTHRLQTCSPPPYGKDAILLACPDSGLELVPLELFFVEVAI